MNSCLGFLKILNQSNAKYISKTQYKYLFSKFKDWYASNCTRAGMMPSGKEVQKYFEKKHGAYPSRTGWTSISFKEEYDENDNFC